MAATVAPLRFTSSGTMGIGLSPSGSQQPQAQAGSVNNLQMLANQQFQPYYLRPAYRFKTNTQQQMGLDLMTDGPGRRLRKNVANVRRHIDYIANVLNYVETRLWQRGPRDRLSLQPDVLYQNSAFPPSATLDKPVDCVLTKFVRAAMNKVKCPIYSICWTPEGKRLITGASTGEFTLWNGTAFNFETILQAHDTAIRALKWSHNDQWLVSADHDGFVKYWQPNMNNVHMYQAHKDEPIRALSFAPTDVKLVTGSDDGTARIWDFARCAEEKVLRGHGSDVRSVDWHPQKGLICTGSRDSQQPVKLWDPKSGQCLATLHDHKNSVMAVQWNRNGNWLLTGSRDHLIKMYDIRMMREMHTYRGHKKEVTALAWSPVHESLFVSGGGDGSLAYWLVNSEKELGFLEHAHDQAIWTLEWHPLGHILASGSNDNNTKFWARNRPGDTQDDIFGLASFSAAATVTTDKESKTEGDDKPSEAAIIPGMGLDDDIYQVLQNRESNKAQGGAVSAANPSGPLLFPDDPNTRQQGSNIGAKRTLIKQPPPKKAQRQFERMWNVAKPGGGGDDYDDEVIEEDGFRKPKASLLGPPPPSMLSNLKHDEPSKSFSPPPRAIIQQHGNEGTQSNIGGPDLSDSMIQPPSASVQSWSQPLPQPPVIQQVRSNQNITSIRQPSVIQQEILPPPLPQPPSIAPQLQPIPPAPFPTIRGTGQLIWPPTIVTPVQNLDIDYRMTPAVAVQAPVPTHQAASTGDVDLRNQQPSSSQSQSWRPTPTDSHFDDDTTFSPSNYDDRNGSETAQLHDPRMRRMDSQSRGARQDFTEMDRREGLGSTSHEERIEGSGPPMMRDDRRVPAGPLLPRDDRRVSAKSLLPRDNQMESRMLGDDRRVSAKCLPPRDDRMDSRMLGDERMDSRMLGDDRMNSRMLGDDRMDSRLLGDDRMVGPGSSVIMRDERAGGGPSSMREERMGGGIPPAREERMGGGLLSTRDERLGVSPLIRDDRMGGPLSIRQERLGGPVSMREDRMGGLMIVRDERMGGHGSMRDDRIGGLMCTREERMGGGPVLMRDDRMVGPSSMREEMGRCPTPLREERMGGIPPMMRDDRMGGPPHLIERRPGPGPMPLCDPRRRPHQQQHLGIMDDYDARFDEPMPKTPRVWFSNDMDMVEPLYSDRLMEIDMRGPMGNGYGCGMGRRGGMSEYDDHLQRQSFAKYGNMRRNASMNLERPRGGRGRPRRGGFI